MKPTLPFIAAVLAVLIPPTTAFAERAHFPICSSGKRVTCIVDGDTIWLRGEKIRLEGIDAPEISQPRCAYEAGLGGRATQELQNILNSSDFTTDRNGQDRYGRTLARLRISGTTAGQMLVDRGLAKIWEGRKAEWC